MRTARALRWLLPVLLIACGGGTQRPRRDGGPADAAVEIDGRGMDRATPGDGGRPELRMVLDFRAPGDQAVPRDAAQLRDDGVIIDLATRDLAQPGDAAAGGDMVGDMSGLTACSTQAD